MTRLSDHNARCVECRRPFHSQVPYVDVACDYCCGVRHVRHRMQWALKMMTDQFYQPHSTRTTRTV